MKLMRKNAKLILLGSALLAVVLVWYAVVAESRGVVTVAFLDAGQGDSILTA